MPQGTPRRPGEPGYGVPDMTDMPPTPTPGPAEPYWVKYVVWVVLLVVSSLSAYLANHAGNKAEVAVDRSAENGAKIAEVHEEVKATRAQLPAALPK